MKKYIFIAVALLSMAVCSCKKESKTDPTPQDPVVTSDSLNIIIRIYATIDQMKYVNYKAYFTPNGETEKELLLTKTVELDSALDKNAYKAIIFNGYDSDSVLAYSFDMKVKKGTQSIRFEGTAKDTVMPETIDIISGYSINLQKSEKGTITGDVERVSFHLGTITNDLDRFFSSKSIAGPFTVNAE